jgi:hypothetical protein
MLYAILLLYGYKKKARHGRAWGIWQEAATQRRLGCCGGLAAVMRGLD